MTIKIIFSPLSSEKWLPLRRKGTKGKCAAFFLVRAFAP
jgi:hypothetical protein